MQFCSAYDACLPVGVLALTLAGKCLSKILMNRLWQHASHQVEPKFVHIKFSQFLVQVFEDNSDVIFITESLPRNRVNECAITEF